MKGFEEAGLFPLNLDVIMNSVKIAPSTFFKENKNQGLEVKSPEVPLTKQFKWF